jgi:hypothetical protein
MPNDFFNINSSSDLYRPLVTSSYGSFDYEETEDRMPEDIELDTFKELTQRVKENSAANFSHVGARISFDVRNKGGQDYEKTVDMVKEGNVCMLNVKSGGFAHQKIQGTLGEMNKFISEVLDGMHPKWEMPKVNAA